jgi:hypothetical protein
MRNSATSNCCAVRCAQEASKHSSKRASYLQQKTNNTNKKRQGKKKRPETLKWVSRVMGQKKVPKQVLHGSPWFDHQQYFVAKAEQ